MFIVEYISLYWNIIHDNMHNISLLLLIIIIDNEDSRWQLFQSELLKIIIKTMFVLGNKYDWEQTFSLRENIFFENK